MSQFALADLLVKTDGPDQGKTEDEARKNLTDRIKSMEAGRVRPQLPFLQRVADLLEIDPADRTNEALREYVNKTSGRDLVVRESAPKYEALMALHADERRFIEVAGDYGLSKGDRTILRFRPYSLPVFGSTILCTNGEGSQIIGHLEIVSGELRLVPYDGTDTLPVSEIETKGVLVSYTVEGQDGLLLPSR